MHLPLDDRGLPPDYCVDTEREITPRQLKARLEAGENIDLIDCRLLQEWQLTRIEGARHLPLQELPARFGREFTGPRDRQTVVYCRSGHRSLHAVEFLRAAGLTDVRSMAGGINVWNRDVEPGGIVY